MSKTSNLSLPELDGQQALKHITHNEALWVLDNVVQLVVLSIEENTPPEVPVVGDCYCVGTTPTAEWDGHANDLAFLTPGGWRYASPKEGWLLWHVGQKCRYVFVDGQWELFSSHLGEIQNAALVGVNAIADTTNRLLVKSDAALFTAIPVEEGGAGNARINLNKSDTAKTSSLVFQSNYSARAEIGTVGDDDFSFKVSADGLNFHASMTLDAAEGFVTFGEIMASRITYPQIAAGVLNVTTSYVVPAPETGLVDQVDTISGGKDGAILMMSGTHTNQITFKDGIGNLKLITDRVLSHFEDTLMLIRRGSDWLELSYAQNG